MADWFAQLRGTAACRGERWANTIWPRVHRAARSSTWPATERARTMAIVRVADLSADQRIRQALADELEAWAARRWEQLRSA